MGRQELQDFIDKHGECEVMFAVHSSKYDTSEVEGYLSQQGDYWYILNDERDGAPAPELHTYRYSWSLGTNAGLCNQLKSICLLEEVEEVPVTLEQFKNEKIAIHCETEDDASDVCMRLRWKHSISTGYYYYRGINAAQTWGLYEPEDYRIVKAKDFLRWNMSYSHCEMPDSKSHIIKKHLTKTIMETIREIPKHLNRVFNKEARILYQAGFITDNAEHTDHFHQALDEVLYDAHRDAILEKAQERIKKLEKESKK